VLDLSPQSPVQGKILPGDSIVRITTQPQGDSEQNPTLERLMILLNEAGQQDRTVDFVVARNGEEVAVPGLSPSMRLENKRRGLGVSLTVDVDHPVVAEVAPNSAAAAAGIPRHSTIRTINGQPVASWFDVHRVLATASPAVPLEVGLVTREGEERTVTMPLSAQQAMEAGQIRYAHDLPLADRIEPRRTSNPFVAAAWGVTETRDLIIQFYLTLQRMAEGRVSPTNLMGPIGIVSAGSRIAYKGNDWLIWFLAMISANLAVVNFLPIPIVDGGLFVFLILEKIMGRPLSPRAQSIAQIVGLALILSVFLFVTYQDINRFF
jgi:regulator of sigma E protease